MGSSVSLELALSLARVAEDLEGIGRLRLSKRPLEHEQCDPEGQDGRSDGQLITSS
jgi:hypothetical protein